MIPENYKCRECGITGVKLWRPYQTTPVDLLCGPCVGKKAGKEVDLSDGDQCGWHVPAVPDLQGSWWGYTSVPAEGCAWWDALPLKLTGEWAVKGGTARWMPYREGMDLTRDSRNKLLRVDFHREGGAVVLLLITEVSRARCPACNGRGVRLYGRDREMVCDATTLGENGMFALNQARRAGAEGDDDLPYV